MKNLDGSGLFRGERGFGKGIIVDENGFLEEKLLKRLQIGRNLGEIGDRSIPSVVVVPFAAPFLLHFANILLAN